ncbi:MAG: hypothetical protein KGS72_22885 [Cyanobacteria bacterium REEB67]|nr:hypothetical protein [Cyanobacteria bacterium REEB67]
MAHYNNQISAPNTLLKGLAAFALLLGLLSASAPAANCQSYRGPSRVVAGAGGLSTPSGSYITGGTLSRSAQVGAGLSTYNPYLPSGCSTAGVAGAGLTPGISGNSSLPSARMGSTVGMPGDYMRSDLNPNFSYQQQPRHNTQYRNQRQYYQQQQQQSGNQVATYGQGYSRNSLPTGRQARQVPTYVNNNNGGGGGGAASAAPAAGGGTSEYKGY